MKNQFKKSDFLLSILCHGRNEASIGNFIWRLSTILNKHAENIMFLGLEQQVEILVSDWGSESPFHTLLELSENARNLVKFLIVSPDIAALYDKGAGYSLPHAINSIARRAQGDYLLFSDSDVYMPIETMAKLMYYLKLGYCHSFNLSDSFFRASKYLVPNDFIADSPYREHLEEHIRQNCQSYLHETATTENLSGSGVCLLMSKAMWFEATGYNERLEHLDLLDSDLSKRLLSKYRWDDLESHGMKFFQLGHDQVRNNLNQAAGNGNPIQTTNEPIVIGANPSDWGLSSHDFSFFDGFGLPINTTSVSSMEESVPCSNRIGPILSVQKIVATFPRYQGIERRFGFDAHSFFCNADAVQCLLYVLQPEIVCEIGSWMGASARCLAAPPSVKQVVCVDHWDRNRIEKYKPGVHPEHMMNNMYEQFLANAVHSGTADKIFPLRMDSDSAAVYCAEKEITFDLIYIDGDHTTVGARADILRWYSLLNPGGYVCGDDWGWQKEPDNVAGAVVSVAREKDLQVFFHGNFWLMTPGGFSIQPLTIEILRGIKPIRINPFKVPDGMDKQPLVSIFCTCKNAETTIRRHIKSVINAIKYYDNIEYIVQDGMSTDATLEIFDEYRGEFGDKLQLISAQDSCCEEGFWLAMSRCRGEIVCASLADEEILPDAIPFVVEHFHKNAEWDVIHGDIYNTDIEGNVRCRNPSKDFDLGNYLAHQSPMHLAASFFRKSAFFKAELLPFPNKHGLLKDDFFTWAYLGLAVKMKYFPVVFAKYAVHCNALSIRQDLLIDNISRRLSFLNEFFAKDYLPPEVKFNRNIIMTNFYTISINRLMNANFINEAEKYKAALTELVNS
ncbi:MAG: glycosyltransferase [Candidatus Ozemobacteraceae bacterium]